MSDLETKDAAPKCPLDKKYGEIVCRDGVLWALTWSEMAPPDSRQAIDDCPHCKKRRGLQ